MALTGLAPTVPGSLRGRHSRRPVQCTREGPKRSKMALTGLAPTVPGSLRGRQRQSQTGSMYSGGSQKDENGLNWFGTEGSWKSARASKTVADRFNVLGRVPKRSKMALTGLAPKVPGSLRGRQRQSQTGSMYSGGFQKGRKWP